MDKYKEELETPVIPYVKIKHKNKVVIKYYYCGNCSLKYFDELDSYCDVCGQKVDWSWKDE